MAWKMENTHSQTAGVRKTEFNTPRMAATLGGTNSPSFEEKVHTCNVEKDIWNSINACMPRTGEWCFTLNFTSKTLKKFVYMPILGFNQIADMSHRFWKYSKFSSITIIFQKKFLDASPSALTISHEDLPLPMLTKNGVLLC